eukprot:3881714-Rhodomonas_salina.1
MLVTSLHTRALATAQHTHPEVTSQHTHTHKPVTSQARSARAHADLLALGRSVVRGLAELADEKRPRVLPTSQHSAVTSQAHPGHVTAGRGRVTADHSHISCSHSHVAGCRGHVTGSSRSRHRLRPGGGGARARSARASTPQPPPAQTSTRSTPVATPRHCRQRQNKKATITWVWRRFAWCLQGAARCSGPGAARREPPRTCPCGGRSARSVPDSA